MNEYAFLRFLCPAQYAVCRALVELLKMAKCGTRMVDQVKKGYELDQYCKWEIIENYKTRHYSDYDEEQGFFDYYEADKLKHPEGTAVNYPMAASGFFRSCWDNSSFELEIGPEWARHIDFTQGRHSISLQQDFLPGIAGAVLQRRQGLPSYAWTEQLIDALGRLHGGPGYPNFRHYGEAETLDLIARLDVDHDSTALQMIFYLTPHASVYRELKKHGFRSYKCGSTEVAKAYLLDVAAEGRTSCPQVTDFDAYDHDAIDWLWQHNFTITAGMDFTRTKTARSESVQLLMSWCHRGLLQPRGTVRDLTSLDSELLGQLCRCVFG